MTTSALLGTWLAGLGLEQYEGLFRENDVDLEILPDLSEDDLENLGVSLGHRKMLLRAIAALGESPSPGAKLAGELPQPYIKTVSEPVEAERRQLTVMFCDLVGSTALAEQLDPEDLRNIIRSYQDACADVISRFEGYIARYVGDGLLVYFGFPRAHEDDAERAVRSALGLLGAVGTLAPNDGKVFRVRIGIATGLVVVGDIIGEGASQEQIVMGTTPNLAARLQGVATPNSVLIAASTRELLGDQFDYEDLGPHTLKGISGPTQAWRVIGERAVESRFGATHADRLTTFVGREQEVELLLDRWRQALAGEGQVVLLSGGAGIGKSRITETLRERLGNVVLSRNDSGSGTHLGDHTMEHAATRIGSIGLEGLALGRAADVRFGSKADSLSRVI